MSEFGTERYGPSDVICPHCHEEVHVEAGPTRRCEIQHGGCGWMVVDLVKGTSGLATTDGGELEIDSPSVNAHMCEDCGENPSVMLSSDSHPRGPNLLICEECSVTRGDIDE